MSQEYTPVQWVDETPDQIGTVINKARLDQMQTAHHYADGFEEVDAVPTADPQVDYHKVVFCTADTTFYRWDGTQWVKDVDDSTLALLQAHEADHNNPHVVTKSQVGLGNVDNKASVSSWQTTPDNDHIPTEKLVKDSLDGKVAIIPVTSGVKFYAQSSGGTTLYQGTSSPVTGVTSVPMRDSSGRIKTTAPSADDDATNKKYVDDADALKLSTSALVSAWQTTPDDSHIPSEKLVKTYIDTSLTDGSVTKIGTATVGGDLKPVYLNAGVPTAVANDFVDVSSAQTITGVKTFKSSGFTSVKIASSRLIGNIGGVDFINSSDLRSGSIYTGTNGLIYLHSNPDGLASDNGLIALNQRAYNASNTYDVVTIGSLQASSDVVHTTGNENIGGSKTFTSDTKFKTTGDVTDGTASNHIIITVNDKNDSFMANFWVRITTAGNTALYTTLRNSDGTQKNVLLASGDII